MMKRAIVVGASSGIGRALAKLLARQGYTVGLAARRESLLRELQAEIGAAARVKQIDVADPDRAMPQLAELIAEMDGVDLVVLTSGAGHRNPDLDWELEREPIDVNVYGFTAMANVAMRHFLQRGAGHLVSISSIAGLRGNRIAPAYAASKAFVSTYTYGLRCKVKRLGLPIAVTEIQPGFVDTAMGRGEEAFWVASPEVAAEQIFTAIRRRKEHAYITRRWRLFAWVMKLAPDWLYYRLG